MNRFVAAVALIAAAGCTMCPDPYDYSGPVPNGSAPQNDFRSRSQGIIPIGMLPKPWPQIVGQKVEGAGEAVVSAGPVRVPELVAQALAAESGRQVSVLQPIPDEDDETAVSRASAEKADGEEPPEAGSVPVVVPEVELDPVETEVEETAEPEETVVDPMPDDVDSREEAAADGLLPPRQPVFTVPVGPVPRETPGWRPRGQL